MFCSIRHTCNVLQCIFCKSFLHESHLVQQLCTLWTRLSFKRHNKGCIALSCAETSFTPLQVWTTKIIATWLFSKNEFSCPEGVYYMDACIVSVPGERTMWCFYIAPHRSLALPRHVLGTDPNLASDKGQLRTSVYVSHTYPVLLVYYRRSYYQSSCWNRIPKLMYNVTISHFLMMYIMSLYLFQLQINV